MTTSKMTGKTLRLSIYLLASCSSVSISLHMSHRLLLKKMNQLQRYTFLRPRYYPSSHSYSPLLPSLGRETLSMDELPVLPPAKGRARPQKRRELRRQTRQGGAQ